MKRIQIDVNGRPDRVKVTPVDFLGAEFGQYRAACDRGGARFDATLRANVAALEAVPRLVEALRSVGLEALLSPALAAQMQARAAAAAQDGVAATERSRAVDAELAKRGLALFSFQRGAVQWLSQRRTAALFSEQGTGKTIMTLAAVPAGARMIVVAPAVVKGVWAREIPRWRPDLRAQYCTGRGSFRLPAESEAVVLNFDILPKSAAELQAEMATLVGASADAAARLPQLTGWALLGAALVVAAAETVRAELAGELAAAEAPLHPETVLVVDEAHLCKGGNRTQRGRRILALRDRVLAAGGRIYILTGTPLVNRPMELWIVLEIAGLAQEAFGSFGAYMRLYDAQRGRYGIEWGQPSPEVAQRLQHVSLRHERAQVLPDLPTKIYETMDVEISAAARRACDRIAAALRARGIDILGQFDAAEARKVLGAEFQELAKARAELATAKIPAMLQLVEEAEAAGEPLVVASAHRAPIDTLKGRDGWAVITGDTAPADRTRIEDEFQNGRLLGVAMTIRAGGIGITLTRSNRIVFVDRDYTPAANQQTEDRICRIGQTRGCIVTSLTADHEVDRRVNELLTEKALLVADTVSASAVTTDCVTTVAQSLASVQATVGIAAPTSNRNRAQNDADRAVAEAFLRLPATSDFVKSLQNQYADSGWSPRQWDAARRNVQEQQERAARQAAADAQRAERDRVARLSPEQQKRERRLQSEQKIRAKARASAQQNVENETVRGPATAQERWAAEAVAALDGMNPDMATVENGEGFNKPDSGVGQFYAFSVQQGGLTDQQWIDAVKLCRKYHGQIGRCPQE